MPTPADTLFEPFPTLDDLDPLEDIEEIIPKMSLDKKSGVVTVENLLINCDTEEFITAKFRGLRGKDDVFFQEIMGASNGQGHWRLLSRLCIQWGDSDSVTSGEFLTDQMPMDSLNWLRANLIVGHYFRIPGSTR
jgi:hypothetical protein